MILLNQRYSDNGRSTQGLFFIDGVFACHMLEDTHRDKKILKETRIPAGEYRVDLRTDGLLNQKYKKRYSFHEGMLWIREIPDFKYIYFHTGSTKDHTAGCPLMGDNVKNNQVGDGLIWNSRIAYTRLYPIIAKEILDKKSVIFIVKDEKHLK